MIVVDANIIAYRSIEGQKTALAIQIEQLDSVWAVPALCRHELASVLLQHVRHDRISREDVPSFWDGVEAIIGGNAHEVPLPEAVVLAHERNISAYDAQYLWLAQELETDLITEDKKLIASSPRNVFSMQRYIELRQ